MHCRFEKNTRYYELLLQKNLFGKWQLTRIYGGIGTRSAHAIHELFDNVSDANQRFQKLSDFRIMKRNYIRKYDSDFCHHNTHKETQ
tara:strand:- start:8652 stop:8912 length:261 start_codon:yes stop_codon:yes gene_type:complete